MATALSTPYLSDKVTRRRKAATTLLFGAIC